MALIPAQYAGGAILSKEISSGETVPANSYVTVSDTELAGKIFEGFVISQSGGKTVTITSCYISNERFAMNVSNFGSSNVNIGKITVYYREPF